MCSNALPSLRRSASRSRMPCVAGLILARPKTSVHVIAHHRRRRFLQRYPHFSPPPGGEAGALFDRRRGSGHLPRLPSELFRSRRSALEVIAHAQYADRAASLQSTRPSRRLADTRFAFGAWDLELFDRVGFCPRMTRRSANGPGTKSFPRNSRPFACTRGSPPNSIDRRDADRRSSRFSPDHPTSR